MDQKSTYTVIGLVRMIFSLSVDEMVFSDAELTIFDGVESGFKPFNLSDLDHFTDADTKEMVVDFKVKKEYENDGNMDPKKLTDELNDTMIKMFLPYDFNVQMEYVYLKVV
jgi:hypothetical protein